MATMTKREELLAQRKPEAIAYGAIYRARESYIVCDRCVEEYLDPDLDDSEHPDALKVYTPGSISSHDERCCEWCGDAIVEDDGDEESWCDVPDGAPCMCGGRH